MKIFTFILVFLVAGSAVSQQVMWSTVENDSIDGRSIKHLPIDEVIHEAGKFYDFYDYYFDGTGFNKEAYVLGLEAAEKNEPGTDPLRSYMLGKLSSGEEPVAVCLKSNEGIGSIVTIIYINGNNLDMLAYSNNMETGAIYAHQMSRGKFMEWYREVME